MIKIHLVRHGQTLWNKKQMFQGSKDSPLTEEGINQAQKLAFKFKNENFKFDKIYSSPMGRAFSTAKIITENKFHVTPIEEFVEISIGDMEGTIFSEFESRFPQEYYNFFNCAIKYDPTPFNGETFFSLLSRVERGLKKIVEENPDNSTILVVTHGIALKAIFSYINNDKKITLNNFEQISVPENTSLSTIIYDHQKFSIENFSDISHLNI